MRWVAGLLLTVVVIVGLGVMVFVATSGDDPLVLDLEPGDCFELALDDDAAQIGTVRTVDCAEPHEAEVVARGSLARDGQGDVPVDRPSDEALFAEADARCAAALADRPDVLERFGLLPIVADEASWEAFDGRFVCVAIPYGGGTTTGSALDAEG